MYVHSWLDSMGSDLVALCKHEAASAEQRLGCNNNKINLIDISILTESATHTASHEHLDESNINIIMKQTPALQSETVILIILAETAPVQLWLPA